VNRALRAATMGALLSSSVALSACSAGQITQTAQQDRDRVGGTTDAGSIILRAVTIEAPRGPSLSAGDDVELAGAIVNTTDEVDTLLSIEGEGFEDARLLGDATGGSQSSGSNGDLGIEIPRDETVFLGDDGAVVLLENLSEDLTPGQSIELTMTFEQAGEVAVLAQVDNPDERDEREAFDFHEGEGEGEGAGQPENPASEEDTQTE
jgi:copper(I)-binding protein